MKNKIVSFIQKQLFELTNNKFSKNYVELCIMPIIIYIVFSKKNRFLVSGSQGIGKSTLVKILEKSIKKFYNLNVLTLSLDDYYLKKEKREKLSKKIHPLLLTRGVPGTHDVKRLIKNINDFNKDNLPYYVPIFEKINDDVSKRTKKINFKADILILEGWCCGATPIQKKYLHKNINIIEKTMDSKMIWREYYNNKLKKDYNKLFNLFNDVIYLKAPSFNYIFNWRLKQEKKLKIGNQKIMKQDELKTFILYYEKITKWMMKTLPKKADIVIYVNKNQKITKINYKKKF
tara:strand:- start:2485 stop:3351 length:867 start_codon:yes stop_codon:yes gene_type:complete